jgi:hypothetical protein
VDLEVEVDLKVVQANLAQAHRPHFQVVLLMVVRVKIKENRKRL